MHKFKVGEWAWSPEVGFCVLKSFTDDTYTLSDGYEIYTECGREGESDKHPTLLTEAQANLLGYYREGTEPKKEKKKVKFKWMWQPVYSTSSGSFLKPISMFKTKAEALQGASIIGAVKVKVYLK